MFGAWLITHTPSAAASDTEVVHATGGLNQTYPGSCDGGTNAFFVITQVDTASDAPASITVTFAGHSQTTEPLVGYQGKTAQYSGPAPAQVTGATAVIHQSWSGQFNLSHYYCAGVTTTTTSAPSTTTAAPTTTLPITSSTAPLQGSPTTGTPSTPAPAGGSAAAAGARPALAFTGSTHTGLLTGIGGVLIGGGLCLVALAFRFRR